jgi:uncharacterized protein (TIGR02996 family)
MVIPTNEYLEDPEYLALLETIRTNPKDVATKLVIADMIQDFGDDDRAEWIRESIAHPAYEFSDWVQHIPGSKRHPLILAGINKDGGNQSPERRMRGIWQKTGRTA